ncbi:hypothetical protein [uncultured Rhodoblastus sp.]|uniref:hypothetical protein n=1 Tax=uncultured Rhodoblastus sp. TaxID=543037 RepID=UPI0025F53369|nr:hypothetical protein [uncultured Rhodoblastus sp.]
MLDARFLLSVHRAAFGEAPLERLKAIGAAFGMPAAICESLGTSLDGADIVHFGFEGGPDAEIYKIYFEYAERTRAAMARREPQPTLVHLAHKWDRLRPGTQALTRYVWSPCRSRADIEARLRALAQDNEAARAMRCTLGLLDRSDSLAQSGRILMMEVEEEGNPRHSWDLNVYDADLTVAAAADLIEEAADDFSVPQARIKEFLGGCGNLALGHLSAGVGRNGDEFVTFYFGIEPH